MKIPLLILVIWLSIPVSAQKIHFTDTTNVWTIHHTGDGPDIHHYIHTFNYRANCDTVIHAIPYKIILAPLVWWSSYQGVSGAPAYSYVREDTVLNKVFILTNDTEQVLMDYNLQAGDSITHKDYYRNWTFIDTVLRVDSVMVNSVFHKVWHFNNVYYTPFVAQNESYSVIEGIGCLLGPFYMPLPNWGLNYYKLLCFHNNGIKLPVSPAVQSYWEGFAYFDNQSNCTLGLNEKSEAQHRIDIYPNPTNNYITITSPKKITSLTITNLIGQTLYTQTNNADKLQIDVSGFPAGMYLLRINGSEIRKFLKN